MLKSERIELLNGIPANRRPQATDYRSNEEMDQFEFEAGTEKKDSREYPQIKKVREINGEIKGLTEKNNNIEEQIKVLLKGK